MSDEINNGLRRTCELRFIERTETEPGRGYPDLPRTVVRRILQQRYESVYVDGHSIWVDVPLISEDLA